MRIAIAYANIARVALVILLAVVFLSVLKPLSGLAPEPLLTEESEWVSAMQMPAKSYFSGFDPPRDADRWKLAVQQARSGQQVLLNKVMGTIRVPGELLTGEKKFRWLHRLTDVFVSRHTGFKEPMKNYTNTHRAPIVMMGYNTFDHPNHEGRQINSFSYSAKYVLKHVRSGRERFTRKFVAIGGMDENWGWLSTHFLNRTASWGFTFSNKYGPMRADQTKEISPFLDNPSVVMLVVNQHHNISHKKVISIPRGVLPNVAKVIWDEGQHAVRHGVKKNRLLFVASSKWGTRGEIIDCVAESVGRYMHVERGRKLTVSNYIKDLTRTYAVLCVPGLGYDTFRLWETLASGSMPIVERGVGFDRVLYKLPALIVDDFADLTPDLIKHAYVEAMYRADQWDYKRMTTRWWERLIYKVSETGSIATLLRLHPLTVEDESFTRPMVPGYVCDEGSSRGCGKGTKRVPRRSCAIDTSTNFTNYNFYWEQFLQWPQGWPLPGHKLYGQDPMSFVEARDTDDAEVKEAAAKQA